MCHREKLDFVSVSAGMAIGHPTEGVNIPMVRSPIMGDDNDPKKTCLDCRNHPVFGLYCTGTVSSPIMTPWYFRISVLTPM